MSTERIRCVQVDGVNQNASRLSTLIVSLTIVQRFDKFPGIFVALMRLKMFLMPDIV